MDKNIQDFYKEEGIAIFIKGRMVLGIHPDNVENNLDALNSGAMKINWKSLSWPLGTGDGIYLSTTSKDNIVSNNRCFDSQVSDER